MKHFPGAVNCFSPSDRCDGAGYLHYQRNCKNTKGEKIQSATVFITGTQKMTMTDADGGFTFKGIIPGNYQVVVNMLGYNSIKEDITLKNGPETLNLVLSGKDIALKEVVIAVKKQSKRNMNFFYKYFMGPSYNPDRYKILNPEIIDFVDTDTALTATTSDFLIIENKVLGYRVKYLLKAFVQWYDKNNTYYDGDYIFEPMEGSPAQEYFWAENRKRTYYGSLMHFYRSVYAGTTRKEGFLMYKRNPDNKGVFASVERNPADVEQMVARTDSNYINIKIDPRVNIVYDKEKASQPDEADSGKTKSLAFSLGNKGSLILVVGKVDSRGA
ncbi:carboxypeptidase-like regulatory domain-containing protein [Mucilaginibacter sp. S1162]|uniref:Carboxypeptidase-like regulatory domain-containing protein n=1 Tax=Mucilaginibacter humi TaxID=2732510 RepID=A0ABX1W7A6_9SPHI|nr:carboxypeptidase-like regulatory domain-containing protein [Mucilaginibacter humi]NNU34605.1 carboxypeptidase-like regulatory domain-containing protein [Mucilaginibacter humi]